MKGPIAWFASNHVAATLLLCLIVLSGLVAVVAMPQKSFPDLEVPIISITVPYLGAAPQEVEQGVCIRIEEELEGIEGVKQIRSNANEGLCTVSVELFDDTDRSKALDDVSNRIDGIFGDLELDLFGIHQRDILFDQAGFGLGQDAHEIGLR